MVSVYEFHTVGRPLKLIDADTPDSNEGERIKSLYFMILKFPEVGGAGTAEGEIRPRLPNAYYLPSGKPQQSRPVLSARTLENKYQISQ